MNILDSIQMNLPDSRQRYDISTYKKNIITTLLPIDSMQVLQTPPEGFTLNYGDIYYCNNTYTTTNRIYEFNINYSLLNELKINSKKEIHFKCRTNGLNRISIRLNVIQGRPITIFGTNIGSVETGAINEISLCLTIIKINDMTFYLGIQHA